MRIIALVTVASCLVWTGYANSTTEIAPQKKTNPVKTFMRAKLGASDKVLEGLVTENFDLIEKGAEEMRVMGLRAEWNVHKTDAYKSHSETFQSAAKRLVQAAKSEKIDAASLSYLQLTFSCINCHRLVRSIKITGSPQLNEYLKVAEIILPNDSVPNEPVPNESVAAEKMELAAVALVENARWSDQKKKSQRSLLSKFMREKLKFSNNILEGLVTEDYDLMATGAMKLQKMSSAEKWRVSNDAVYRHWSVEFRRITGKLQDQAKKKKLEWATLTWIETTMSCIECHRHVRSMLITDK